MRKTALLLVALAAPIQAQYSLDEARSVAWIVASWSSLPAPPGAETAPAMELMGHLVSQGAEGWVGDNHMNLIKRVGSGNPKRIVACGLDYSSYVVSQITDQGYLRLRRSGTAGH